MARHGVNDRSSYDLDIYDFSCRCRSEAPGIEAPRLRDDGTSAGTSLQSAEDTNPFVHHERPGPGSIPIRYPGAMTHKPIRQSDFQLESQEP